jgi:PAS domain S-box-containing protein
LRGRKVVLTPGLPNARWMVLVPFVVLGSTVAIARFVRTCSQAPEDLPLIDELTRRVVQIVENARLHQELRRSERRFRLALEHARVSIFEEDAESRVRFIYNPKLGAVADEAIGQRLADKVPPEQAERIDALKRELIATGEGFRVEVQPKPDVHLVVQYEPLRDTTGAIAGFVGAAIDVTDERQAQKELAEGLAFHEQMMGVLGHDLRNPLGAVRGLSQLWARHPELPDKGREALERIDQAARRMSEMIDTLLAFTHSRFHGSLPVERQPADLAEVTRTVVEELRVAHPARDIRLRSPERLPGEWDPARMAQVVSNLVGNALTHGAPDSPVEISLANGDGVVLSVANRGEPIPQELRARMFEPFRRGENGHHGRPRGLGLGLYIAREIVTAHGGSIGVESGGDATVFRVRFD